MSRFAALGDPTRLAIVELLGEGAHTAGGIGRRFPISAPAVSQHLKVLRETGLVRVEVDGQRRIYSLNPQGFEEMERWLGKMRSFWSGRLDALERALETDGRERRDDDC